ncbi:translation initiation factor IF-2 [Cronobacter turicensis]|nr:translation initiation factor IF-2 [Cronobacter turicensis]EMA1790114.1 translation initiation factor IF-2 [Cronobacter turicensis]EMA1800178.1 translation initiation factor IF-2 [Cronobacter turicensis]EMA1847391.1 translation initiation factor IF-2 [Cronobacter turicensis]EMA1857636.1 translation initiation factor IF-2 [Cronobacter turicensis]
MSISPQTLSGGEQQAMKVLSDNIFSMLRVSMPGIIQSFNPTACTCTVQPAILGEVANEVGEFKSSPLPLLVDVPVIFPRGGGCTITFPVKAGDECLVVFSDRCIDFWWQNGGVQEPVDPRRHDLSDAFAFIGPQSQAEVIGNISTSTLQMRTDDGAAYIELDPNSHAVNIVAPGGLNVTTPLAKFSQAVTITGLLTWMGGMVGSLATGTAAKITGAIEFIGSLKSNGKDISDSHTHSGVQSGTGNSGKVN